MVWWRIDPQTGEPIGDGPAPIDDFCVYLDDIAVDAAGDAATAIKAEFAIRNLSDEELRNLLLERALPASFLTSLDDAAELLQHVVDLWAVVDKRYLEASGRSATPIEKHCLF